MNEAPEKIRAVIDYDGNRDGYFCDDAYQSPPEFDNSTEYTRSDLIPAMIASALAENAAQRSMEADNDQYADGYLDGSADTFDLMTDFIKENKIERSEDTP